MKLETIPKPIRIRIKLGDVECSNLEDVRNNLSYYRELYPLLTDGRLERWLMQIGESEKAEEVKKKKIKCPKDGSLPGYLVLIALFNSEVNKLIVDNPIDNSLFKSLGIQQLRDLYKYTKEEKDGWRRVLENKISSSNALDYINDSQLSQILDDNYVGYICAVNTSNAQDLEKFATGLIHSGSIFEAYFDNTWEEKQSEWNYLLRNNDLQFAIDVYEIVGNRNNEMQWGEIFAKNTKDQNDIEKVEKELENNDSMLNSYYDECENKRPRLHRRKDVWELLAHCIDKDRVKQALEVFNTQFNKDNYKYCLRNKLAIDILELLDFINRLKEDANADAPVFNVKYLSDGVDILKILRNRKKNSGYYFLIETKDYEHINKLASENDFASWIIMKQLKHSRTWFSDIAKQLPILLEKKIIEYES